MPADSPSEIWSEGGRSTACRCARWRPRLGAERRAGGRRCLLVGADLDHRGGGRGAALPGRGGRRCIDLAPPAWEPVGARAGSPGRGRLSHRSAAWLPIWICWTTRAPATSARILVEERLTWDDPEHQVDGHIRRRGSMSCCRTRRSRAGARRWWTSGPSSSSTLARRAAAPRPRARSLPRAGRTRRLSPERDAHGLAPGGRGLLAILPPVPGWTWIADTECVDMLWWCSCSRCGVHGPGGRPCAGRRRAGRTA